MSPHKKRSKPLPIPRLWMIKKGRTVIELSKFIGRPVSECNLILRGYLIPHADEQALISAFLDVPVDKLFKQKTI
jgi:hypothetical protein